MSQHRTHHVIRSLFGSAVLSGLILSGVAIPASALDSAPSDTPTVNQVVDSGDDPVVDPNVEVERCATSRGKGDDCGEPIIEPQAEEEVPTTTTTTAAPVADPEATVAGGGDQVVVPAPVDQVLSEQTEQTNPAPAASLPRTGSGVEGQATAAFGLIGAGITLLALARRRRSAPQG